jgi:cytochrome P450
MQRPLASLAALGLLAAVAATMPAISPAVAHIYDSRVEQNLKLTSAQRAKVHRIVVQGQKNFRAILRKHKININDPHPDMGQLMDASSELSAHKRRQREQMKAVLTPEQLRQYDDLIRATSDRVRKAAN